MCTSSSCQHSNSQYSIQNEMKGWIQNFQKKYLFQECFWKSWLYTFFIYFLLLLTTSNVGNSKSCTFESDRRITWFDELKEWQEFLIVCDIYRFGLTEPGRLRPVIAWCASTIEYATYLLSDSMKTVRC